MDARLTMLSCVCAFAFGGCSGHTHNLIQNQSDGGITIGSFRHEGPEGTSMVLVWRGTRFEAHGFTIERNQNLAELQHRPNSGKHHDRIFSGLDTEHYLYSAMPVLSAGGSETLRCHAAWRAGDSPAGYCIAADGSSFKFHF